MQGSEPPLHSLGADIRLLEPHFDCSPRANNDHGIQIRRRKKQPVGMTFVRYQTLVLLSARLPFSQKRNGGGGGCYRKGKAIRKRTVSNDGPPDLLPSHYSRRGGRAARFYQDARYNKQNPPLCGDRTKCGRDKTADHSLQKQETRDLLALLIIHDLSWTFGHHYQYQGRSIAQKVIHTKMVRPKWGLGACSLMHMNGSLPIMSFRAIFLSCQPFGVAPP